MQFIDGLVSVSYRSLAPDALLSLAQSAGLRAIEWGGDIHVPSGKTEVARAVGDATRQAGLLVPEYGSYYRLGQPDRAAASAVLACARVLSTPRVRIWAGGGNRASLSAAEYAAAVEDARRLCFENPDLLFCLECHGGTITEDYRDALAFLTDTGCRNLRMFWQPNQFRSHMYNLQSLTALLPYVESVHVFSWEGNERLPLSAHADRWAEYLRILRDAPAAQVYLLLEFLHDGRIESLLPAAQTLRQWMQNCMEAH